MATEFQYTRLVLRNDSSAAWLASKDQILLKGEVGIEFLEDGTPKIKIGDGVKTWEQLDYYDGGLAEVVGTPAQGEPDAEDYVKPTGLYHFIEQNYVNLNAIEHNELSEDEFTLPTSKVIKDYVDEVVGKNANTVIVTPEPLASGANHQEAIAGLIGQNEPVAGDIAIVKETITGDKVAYTAYVYNGSAWAAMDGNYSAENVYFNEDLTYTANIGVKTVPASGSGTITAAGKNLEEVMKSILAERKNPTTTMPTVSLGSSNIGAKEVGTNIEIKYEFTTDPGSYSYDDSTGVEFSNYRVTFNGETKSGKSGTFSSVQVTDNTSLSISGTVQSSAGNVPHDNLGDEYTAGQIQKNTANKTFENNVASETPVSVSKGTLSGYRAWFCGYKNGDNAIKNAEGVADATLITGDQIRNLGNSANGNWKSATASKSGSIDVNQMQQMFFAAPAGKGFKPAVADSKTTAPQTVLGPITVYVKGANNYMTEAEAANGGMAYDVWYVNNTQAASGSATLTIKKA